MLAIVSASFRDPSPLQSKAPRTEAAPTKTIALSTKTIIHQIYRNLDYFIDRHNHKTIIII
ncbi:MAG: hypothetical protein WBA89_29950 [Microcoleus sp.]|uniref:hypothetical protein n=1 Tax=unclassified Microcoleus TaxID=2642155 RepID=UPI001D14FC68|nr:hypothetical protein [Microcoleus sp. LEGE 07076]